MTLQQKTSAPPREREGAGVRVPPPTKTETSGVSVAEKTLSDNPPLTLNGHRFLCFFKQEAVYAGNPSGLCFLRGEVFVALTPEDLYELEHSCLPYCFPQLRVVLAAEELEEEEAVVI